MKKHTCIFLIIFTVFTLSSQKKVNENLIVELKQIPKKNSTIKNRYNKFILRSLDENPKYKKKIIDNSIGIPINDSIQFYGELYDSLLFFDLYESGDLTKEEYLKAIEEYKIDTLNLSKIKQKRGLIVVVGFNENKQFIIADSNHNKDFSDDVKYEYDIDFRKKPIEETLSKLQVSKYTYESTLKGITQKHTREFILYPDRYNEKYLNYSKTAQEYLSIIRFSDMWEGEAKIGNKKINFIFDGLDNTFGAIYIKPNEIMYSLTDYTYNDQFQYKFGDTVSLNNKLFKIDSLSNDISKLYLSFIKKKKDNYGSSINNYIKNIQFKDIQEKDINLIDIFKKKKYTLIEFWGTWCGPCIKMTPQIHELFTQNSNKLSILSFAVDRDKEAVQKYITKNDMNWTNGFIMMGKQSAYSIKNQLNITYYPTFILVDSKGKIILRGSIETFAQIKEYLK
ncbi:TlpA family protein disulfide reductase [Flavobacterium terrisoli]|uniref:TlpA family protein disulfide reductase n=1 Tax=Flavobacterium terrisoli TaxID=3242195 RepID=UPI002542C881|nr:TlpA disulfide reductase family protein [Flavobacterium buctense]